MLQNFDQFNHLPVKLMEELAAAVFSSQKRLCISPTRLDDEPVHFQKIEGIIINNIQKTSYNVKGS